MEKVNILIVDDLPANITVVNAFWRRARSNFVAGRAKAH
jgi:CheY-like chemotaxis protein